MNGETNLQQKRGSGSIKLLYNGKAEVNLYIKKLGDKEIRKTRICNPEDAEKVLKELRRQYGKDEEDEILSQTVDERMRIWLYDHKIHAVSNSSFDRLETTVMSQIIPRVGYITCGKLSADMAQRLLINDMIADGYGHSSCKKAREALKACFQQMLIQGLVRFNPIEGTTLPSEKKFREMDREGRICKNRNKRQEDGKVIIVSEEDSHTFVRECLRTYSTGKYTYPSGLIFIFIAHTGLRIGEALGIRYKDIIMVDGQICVCVNGAVVTPIIRDKHDPTKGKRSIKRQEGTKTEAGMRNVPLDDVAIAAITMYTNIIRDNKYSPNDIIFVSNKLTLISTTNADKSCRKICIACGLYNIRKDHNDKDMIITKVTPHILRHTYSSVLLHEGMPLIQISRLLGHTSVAVTEQRYIRLYGKAEFERILKNNESKDFIPITLNGYFGTKCQNNVISYDDNYTPPEPQDIEDIQEVTANPLMQTILKNNHT